MRRVSWLKFNNAAFLAILLTSEYGFLDQLLFVLEFFHV
jgi:hypothetical protein